MNAALVQFARWLAKKLCPGLYGRVSWYRNQGRLERVGKKLARRYGCVVLGGIFQGMKYVNSSRGSVFNPKLVGCYEQQLAPFLKQAIDAGYTTVVDIGSAEGYYAVGLALRLPHAQVIAFDLDPEARQLCHALARLNKVSDRVAILRECSTAELNKLNLHDAFIICDCEGAELEILDPKRVPALRSCNLIVELHDVLRTGLSEALLPRFAATHAVQIVEEVRCNADDYPFLNFLSPKSRRLAVEEFRPKGMQWAILSARR
jgi:predicted O-methyltransferase YrrM